MSGDFDFVIEWMIEQNQKVSVNVERISLKSINKWKFDPKLGSLQHDSGGFFSVDGIRVSTNFGHKQSWDQPIINQPEIGYLGLIAKEFNGILHFLVQAKIEPGNIKNVQLSPTIQATRSNYTQVHKGNKPLYLEYFQQVKSKNVLLDQLQSEQGGRFLMKRNRNIIIYVEDSIPKNENFIWLTLGHIKELMRVDNLVNMDTRTVISGIHYNVFDGKILDRLEHLKNGNVFNCSTNQFFDSAISSNNGMNNLTDIFHFITNLKSKYDLLIDRVPLQDLKEWDVYDDEISREDKKFFKVIGVNVDISNREIVSWQQPMIQPTQAGICAFVCKNIKGVVHFLVQAKLECGNRDVIEMAPTVQSLLGGFQAKNVKSVPFLDYVLNSSKEGVIFDTLQSEEGGRFYQEQNRYLIMMADKSFIEEVPENFIWMTLNQLFYFNQFNNYLNIQTRSLISAISFT